MFQQTRWYILFKYTHIYTFFFWKWYSRVQESTVIFFRKSKVPPAREFPPLPGLPQGSQGNVPIFTCQNKTFENQGLYLWRLECLWILSRCCCWISFDLYHLQNVRRWTLAKKLVRGASNMQGNLERFSWFLDLEIECVGDCWSLFKVNRGILKGSALKDGDEAKLDTLHRSLNLKSFFISAVITPTGGHWLLRLFDVSQLVTKNVLP